MAGSHLRFGLRAKYHEGSKMRRVAILGIVATATLIFAGPAAAYTCSGTIDWVSVSPTGIVTVSSHSSGLAVFYPCSLDSTEYGVAPATCSAIFATLLVAKEAGAQVSWSFNDSLTCNRSTYNGGNWYWLNDGTSVWYYGPQVQ